MDTEIKLEEYKQICEYHRHDDQMKWTIIGLGYTAAGAMLGISVGRAPVSNSGRYLLPILASIIIIGATLIYFDLDSDTRERLRRAHGLEEEIDMKNHRLFPKPEDGEHILRIGVNVIVSILAFAFVMTCLILIIL